MKPLLLCNLTNIIQIFRPKVSFPAALALPPPARAICQKQQKPGPQKKSSGFGIYFRPQFLPPAQPTALIESVSMVCGRCPQCRGEGGSRPLQMVQFREGGEGGAGVGGGTNPVHLLPIYPPHPFIPTHSTPPPAG